MAVDVESSHSYDMLNIRDEEEDEADVDKAVNRSLFTESASGDAQAVAVLVDAETTSFLMMGLLSPGLPLRLSVCDLLALGIKRHAVTLFEGGRVAGDEVISHLISELRMSADVKEKDGEIRKLMQTASSLAEVLECVKQASGNRSIELLRRSAPSDAFARRWALQGIARGIVQRGVNARVVAQLQGYRAHRAAVGRSVAVGCCRRVAVVLWAHRRGGVVVVSTSVL